MDTTPPFQFTKLDRAGLQTLVDWARAEGWNPGPDDAEAFWAADPDGYYGFHDQGELIAGGALVSYSGEYGFMGLFIVRPDYRSRGIGQQLWHQRRDTLLARLKPGAAIGMDGVVAMQPFYNRGGFNIAFRDERHERVGEPFALDPHIAVIEAKDFDEVQAYDARCFGFARPGFLDVWLRLPDNHLFKYTADGRLQGFAVLRKAGTGYKIGPLFADNAAIAESLYRACLDAVPGAAVYLDIPLSNPAAVALVRKYQANYVFECARMYYGRPPAADINRVFGITTFELG